MAINFIYKCLKLPIKLISARMMNATHILLFSLELNLKNVITSVMMFKQILRGKIEYRTNDCL